MIKHGTRDRKIANDPRDSQRKNELITGHHIPIGCPRMKRILGQSGFSFWRHDTTNRKEREREGEGERETRKKATNKSIYRNIKK